MFDQLIDEIVVISEAFLIENYNLLENKFILYIFKIIIKYSH